MVGPARLVSPAPGLVGELASLPAPIPDTYFAALVEPHTRAFAGAGGTVERWVRIAGRGVRLSFAGSALAPVLMPALAHLVGRTDEAPGLSVRLWDSVST